MALAENMMKQEEINSLSLCRYKINNDSMKSVKPKYLREESTETLQDNVEVKVFKVQLFKRHILK